MTPKTLWGRSVLVVDDEDFSRSMVVRMARKLDALQIREARNGSEALGILRRYGATDVVVCDFDMPVMNGLELLRSIRTGSAGDERHMPFAMLTGHSDADLVSAAIRLDVNAFLIKPITLDVLSQRLARILVEEHEIGVPGQYQSIEIPTRAAAPDTRTPAAPEPGGELVMDLDEGRRERRVELANLPENAVLARDVHLRSGIKLLSAGQTMSDRLIAKLNDLRGLDDTVSELWIQV